MTCPWRSIDFEPLKAQTNRGADLEHGPTGSARHLGSATSSDRQLGGSFGYDG